MARDETSENGDFKAFTNLRKKPGDKLPAFTGKLTLPGTNAERGISLWPTTSQKTGVLVISGRVGLEANDQLLAMATNAPAMDADKTIEIMQRDGNSLKVEPNALVLFQNKSKADNAKRPDLFGYYNPGRNQPLMRLSVWTGTDRNGNAYMSGSVQKDMPRPEKGRDDEDEEPEPSVTPEPEGKRERRSGRSR